MEKSTRTGIVILMLIYLVSLFFIMDAIGQEIYADYTTTSQSIGMEIDFLGMKFSVFGGFLGNIVTSIESLPLWFNTLFVTIPSILLAVFTILMFIPTIPSG
jgi:hypothetical protein